MNYAEALAWLYATQERGIKPGLDRTRDFLATLGWTGTNQRFVHVAGTNGKGSVCAMVESICCAAGLGTGLYTSPHLATFRERIRIQRGMLPPETIAAELTLLRKTCETHRIEPTFFEAATVMALHIFQAHGVDAIALETGLGGRLDSTNVVLPRVSVITSIGLDHTAMLGPTLADIAREKAGIIKPGIPIVAGPIPDEAAAVLDETARERNAPLTFVSEPLRDDWQVGLAGSHQRLNAAIALKALEAGGFAIPPEAARAGLLGVEWPARFQRIERRGSELVIDGAHNPDAARQLARTWREQFGALRPTVILGILGDKDAPGICAELANIAGDFLIVPVRTPRSTPPEALLEIAAQFRPARACESLAAALEQTAGSPALVAGSLFLAGEALSLLGLAKGDPGVSLQ